MKKKSCEEITEYNIKSKVEELRDDYNKLSQIELEEKLFFIDKELREEQLKLNKPSEIGNLKDKTIWLLIAFGMGLVVKPMLETIYIGGFLTSGIDFLSTLINDNFWISKLAFGREFLKLYLLQMVNIFGYMLSVFIIIFLSFYGGGFLLKKKIKENDKIQNERSVKIDNLHIEKQIIERLTK